MGIHQADFDAGMAELVKDLNRSKHELALAGDAKNYGMAIAHPEAGATAPVLGCWSVALSFARAIRLR